MLLKNYQPAMEYWKGRIDSTTDYDAFRWHQWVEPIDLNDEKLDFSEIKLGFVFIGFCSEQGIDRNHGRVGAALAPGFLRRQMSSLPCRFSREVKLFDAGNIVLDADDEIEEKGEMICGTNLDIAKAENISLEEGQRLLGLAVNRILELGLFPIVLGGGHETTFGHYQGQLLHAEQKNAKPDLAIVNFDAHFDIRPYEHGSSSGSMFRQIADLCEARGLQYGYMPIGIQEHSNTVSLFKTAQERKVDYILAKKIQNSTFASILERVDYFMYQHESAYITVCTDVFSSAFAPAVSAPQALGLNPEIVLPIIKHVLRTRKIKGFDICEISPRYDSDNTTANLGAVIIFTVVSTLCKLQGLSVELD